MADSRFVFCANPLISEVDVDADSGLGGKLFTLGLAFGGAGSDPTLVVFRTVLPGVGSADPGGEGPVDGAFIYDIDVVLSVGMAGVECVFTGLGVGKLEVVTDRDCGLFDGAAIDEAAEVGLESGASGISGRGFLVLATGSAGRGALGGAVGGGLTFEGRCGIADVIVAVAV